MVALGALSPGGGGVPPKVTHGTNQKPGAKAQGDGADRDNKDNGLAERPGHGLTMERDDDPAHEAEHQPTGA